MFVREGLWATALVASLALSCGDGSSSPAQPSKAGGKGSSGKGGSNGKADGGTGAGRDGGSDGGSSDRDASVDQGPNNSGDLGSIWKRYSSDITIIDPADPVNPVQKTVQLPPIIPVPIDNREVDIYQQIKGDMVLTYAHLDGDQVYYQMSTMLTGSGTVFIGANDSGQFVFELTDGHLVETRTATYAGLTVSMRATYSALTGTFPPSGWPTKKLVLP